MMAQLAPGHMVNDAVLLLGPICVVRQKLKLRDGVDEMLDQPRARHTVHLDSLARNPLHRLMITSNRDKNMGRSILAVLAARTARYRPMADGAATRVWAVAL